MAKKDMCCSTSICGCNPCVGLVLVIFGILYLLVDYGVITWFRLSWWTTAFLIIGILLVCCKR